MAKKRAQKNAAPAAKRSSKRRAASRKPAPATKYSRDYPIAGGHNYLVRSIPRPIWKGASARSKGDQRSIRNVIIRALELYAAGSFAAAVDEAPDAAAAPAGEIFGPDLTHPELDASASSL